MPLLLFWLILALLLGLIPASIAYRKGGSFIAFWIMGALLFILALPWALMLTPDQDVLEARQMRQGMKRCPFCAEMIRREATVCRYCQREQPV